VLQAAALATALADRLRKGPAAAGPAASETAPMPVAS